MKNNKYLFLIILTILIPINIQAKYLDSFDTKNIEPGDNIYFDSSNINWENVYIHIWGSSGDYKSWSNSDILNKINDNIYKFTMSKNSSGNYNMIIFKNALTGGNKTIDLRYIDNNLAFKASTELENGNVTGYWYLYDKSEIYEFLDNANNYKLDKKYYTTDSYGNLDELLLNATNESKKEIKVEMQRDTLGNHTGKYYYSIMPIFRQIDDLIKNLEVDNSILKNKINKEKDNLDEYRKKYTEESINNLINALSNAEKVSNKGNLTVNEIKNELKNIDDAINKLKRIVPKTGDNILKYLFLFLIVLYLIFRKKEIV